MKALSIRQPWAHAVVHLGKNIENRSWKAVFRGEFLIHAAKGMTLAEYEGAAEFICDVRGSYDGIPDPKALPRGGIVGRARLVDVLHPCVRRHIPLEDCEHPWHMPEQFAFVLADVQALPFVPCVGSLGFFEVPADVMRVLEGGAR